MAAGLISCGRSIEEGASCLVCRRKGRAVCLARTEKKCATKKCSPTATQQQQQQHHHLIMASSPPPPPNNKMKKVPPSIFFSSPVIDLTKSGSDSSIGSSLMKGRTVHCNKSRKTILPGVQTRKAEVAVASESTSPSSYSESPVMTNVKSVQVVVNESKVKRKCSEMIEITSRSTSEEEEMGHKIAISATNTTTKKKRDTATDTPDVKPIREYFHARTNQPITSARELLDDSDCEGVDDWLHTMSEKLINDFDDVSEKEKQFMNLWNRFIKCHHVIADKEIPSKVESFIVTNREKLKEGNLRMNLLLHLTNLWDSGLISPTRISSCMTIYDDGTTI